MEEMDSYLQNELGVDMGELNKKVEDAQKDIMIKVNEEDIEESDSKLD